MGSREEMEGDKVGGEKVNGEGALPPHFDRNVAAITSAALPLALRGVAGVQPRSYS